MTIQPFCEHGSSAGRCSKQDCLYHSSRADDYRRESAFISPGVETTQKIPEWPALRFPRCAITAYHDQGHERHMGGLRRYIIDVETTLGARVRLEVSASQLQKLLAAGLNEPDLEFELEMVFRPRGLSRSRISIRRCEEANERHRCMGPPLGPRCHRFLHEALRGVRH